MKNTKEKDREFYREAWVYMKQNNLAFCYTDLGQMLPIGECRTYVLNN